MANEYGSSNQTSEERSGSSASFSNGSAGVGQHGAPAQYDDGASSADDNGLSLRPAGGYVPGANTPANPRAPLLTRGTGISSEFSSEESAGDAPVTIVGTEAAAESAEFNLEVGNPEGQEFGEEFYEATLEQIKAGASAAAAETAAEGFTDTSGTESGAMAGFETIMAEAGTVIDHGPEGAQEEFFPFLAALVPTLISSIGPSVAKQVITRLSPLAKKGIKRLAGAASKVAGETVGLNKQNILKMIARLLESAETRPASESDVEAGEEVSGVAEQAALALEVIIGTDDRVQFTNTSAEPLRRICELRITFPSGRSFRGTGFMIGARSLATAGHCVYLHSEGGWARRVEVIPGANGTSRPFGSAVSTTFRSVAGWVNGKKPEHDYGCIILPTGSFGGRDLGKFGFTPLDSTQLLAKTAYLKGYPGDKPSELWGMHRSIKTVTASTLIYDIDTVGGQSGAPVYIRTNGKRYVVGIHNYGNAGGNSATRLTTAVCTHLKKWSMI